MLASMEQVLAYFLPEAPAEMLVNLDEVCLIAHLPIENISKDLYILYYYIYYMDV